MMLLMFSGACSGSTCGGIKIIRSIIVSKSVRNNSKSVISPREVNFVKVDGKRIDESIVGQAMAFLAIYVIAIALSTVVIYAGAGQSDGRGFLGCAVVGKQHRRAVQSGLYFAVPVVLQNNHDIRYAAGKIGSFPDNHAVYAQNLA